MSTLRHATWHLVPAGDPPHLPGLRSSLLFVTLPGETEQISSASPHTPVTSAVFELSMGNQAAIRHRDQSLKHTASPVPSHPPQMQDSQPGPWRPREPKLLALGT